MINLIIRNPKEIVEGDILHLKVINKCEVGPGIWELVVEHIVEKTAPAPVKTTECSAENPCCDRRGDWNGFGSGPLTFTCPEGCRCHDGGS